MNHSSRYFRIFVKKCKLVGCNLVIKLDRMRLFYKNYTLVKVFLSNIDGSARFRGSHFLRR
jgi:hypothetical protein